MEDTNLHPGFKRLCMYDQLGKILDSQAAEDAARDGSPHYFQSHAPIHNVITDDDWQYTVTPEEAKRIREFVMGIRSQDRLRVLIAMQKAQGFDIIHRLIRKMISYETYKRENAND